MGTGGYGGASYPIRPPSVGTVGSKARSDRSALVSLQRGGMLGLVGGLIGWFTSVYLSSSGALSQNVSTTASGQPMISFNTGAIEVVLLIAVASAAVEVVTLAYFLSAFRALREEDSSFEGPARYLWLALIALPLLLLALAYLLESLVHFANCLNAVPAGANWMDSCTSQAAATGGAILLLLLFAVFALIGWIELLLGVWRLGEHFHESRFRVAAILLIIPFLSVIAAGMVWYYARKLEAQPLAPGSFL
jgi:hypothetical protein